jgi:hypothetical protein
MRSLNESGRDAVEDGTGSDDDDAGGLTRRAVLRESVISASAVGLSLGAVGTAAASGKGGQSAVPAEDYIPEEGHFHFDEATGNFVRKTCEKGGNGIVLAEWTFRYEGSLRTPSGRYTPGTTPSTRRRRSSSLATERPTVATST